MAATSDALNNGIALSQMFGQALSPANNFIATNTALAVQKQRALEEQARQMQILQYQAGVQKQRDAEIAQNQMALAKQAEDAAMQRERYSQESISNRENVMAGVRAKLATDLQVRQEAQTIRADPNIARYLGADSLTKYPDDEKSNRALIQAYYDAKANRGEEIDKQEIINYNTTIKDVIKSLNTAVPGSPQAKSAALAFLNQPGVMLELTKHANLSSQEVAELQAGDPNKIQAAIQKAAEGATYLYGEDAKVKANLLGAWTAALAQAGVATPESIANSAYLQTLVGKRNQVWTQRNFSPDSLKEINKAAGFGDSQAGSHPDVQKLREAAAMGIKRQAMQTAFEKHVQELEARDRERGLLPTSTQPTQFTDQLTSVLGFGPGSYGTDGSSMWMSNPNIGLPSPLQRPPAIDPNSPLQVPPYLRPPAPPVIDLNGGIPIMPSVPPPFDPMRPI